MTNNTIIISNNQEDNDNHDNRTGSDIPWRIRPPQTHTTSDHDNHDHIVHDDIDNHVPNISSRNSNNVHSSTGLHSITTISIPMPIVAVQLITVDHHIPMIFIIKQQISMMMLLRVLLQSVLHC
jgi:hypothetical protein